MRVHANFTSNSIPFSVHNICRMRFLSVRLRMRKSIGWLSFAWWIACYASTFETEFDYFHVIIDSVLFITVYPVRECCTIVIYEIWSADRICCSEKANRHIMRTWKPRNEFFLIVNYFRGVKIVRIGVHNQFRLRKKEEEAPSLIENRVCIILFGNWIAGSGTCLQPNTHSLLFRRILDLWPTLVFLQSTVPSTCWSLLIVCLISIITENRNPPSVKMCGESINLIHCFRDKNSLKEYKACIDYLTLIELDHKAQKQAHTHNRKKVVNSPALSLFSISSFNFSNENTLWLLLGVKQMCAYLTLSAWMRQKTKRMFEIELVPERGAEEKRHVENWLIARIASSRIRSTDCLGIWKANTLREQKHY